MKVNLDEFIPKMDAPEKVYQLFGSLGYKVLDTELKTKPSVYNLPVKEANQVEKIFAVANYGRRFQILLFKLKEDNKEAIRNIPEKILREVDYPFIIFTPDFKTFTFTLVEKLREGPGEFKRKLTKLIVDRESPYHTDKEIISNFILDESTTDSKAIYNTIKNAMSVERVTKKFFAEYKEVFFNLRSNYIKQVNDEKSTHEFTQQILNRIMFLYFISKKRWIGESDKFLKEFWEAYNTSDAKKDTFYEDWLCVLFFEAFNNKFFPKNYFSKKINSTLQLAPFLNGGLFTKQRIDELPFEISDKDILSIFNFFNRYNFTIREDLPLEKEVAVDPEMIGKVYESLVNLSETSDERGDAGIFYTPRSEIDFMCKASLVEYFYKYLGTTTAKEDIYKLIFAKSEKEQQEAIDKLKLADVWPQMFEEKLDGLTVIDPAVGSGSFLVGMLQILTSLYKLVYKDSGNKLDDFKIKKQIIGRSLYGVDVMEWAVHICELRLWLQLIVETEIPFEERKLTPLLPNLSFKVRSGDSLVQKIGDINLSELGRKRLSPAIKRKITALKQAKYDYFFNNESSKFYQSEELLKHEEQLIFQMIIEERILELRREIWALENDGKGENLHLPGMKNGEDKKNLIEKANKKSIEEKQKEIKQLKAVMQSLKQKKPFIWDIDFVEIFSDPDEAGFDIVIGNPPYVRQEKIADPTLPKEKISTENKKQYKDKLVESVKNKYPWIKKLDKKSDLYVYFYFNGFSLLNPLGTLCFITSNSWLDVGYGKNLQEFMLKHVPVYAVFDNQAKRSFESADVNTIILLAGTPSAKEDVYSDNKIKFVMFKKPFEEVITIENLLTIEHSLKVISNPDLRVFPISQYELLKDGWEYPKTVTENHIKSVGMSIGSYGGNKWGAKFLRAPDIYWKIKKNNEKKLIQLSLLGDIHRGFTTGANDFFYLPSKFFEIRLYNDFYKLIPKTDEVPKNIHIEKALLKPFIKGPQYLNKVIPDEPERKVVLLPEDIERYQAKEYVSWGGKASIEIKKGSDKGKSIKGFNNLISLKGKDNWWFLKENVPPNIIINKGPWNRHFVTLNTISALIDQQLYGLHLNDNWTDKEKIIVALMESSIFGLFSELQGRSNFGEGILWLATYEVRKIDMTHPSVLQENEKAKLLDSFELMTKREILGVFEEYGLNPKQEIRSQKPNPLPDRKALDDIVFDALGLSHDERNEVYWSLCELVKNRLEKAKSV